ncbi:MAG: hypothetical protein R3F61_15955 [Myxococcota bacterium]
MQFQLPVQTLSRDTTLLADDELGETLVAMVRNAVPRGTAPTVVTVARPERIDVIGLKPVVDHHIPIQGFIASLTRADVEPTIGDARAVGIMGTVKLRQSGQEAPAPMAVVFLEWPDNRWWLWRALIDPESKAILTETETLTRAIDGDPMPVGFGRWWSLARRTGMRVTMRHAAPPPVVH